MGQPILFVVTEDDQVLQALTSDLRRRYSADYQIVAAPSAAAALPALEQLAAHSEQVALLVAAQRLGQHSGVDFLTQAHRLHPAARRVLLLDRGDYTAANPAVQAMTLGQIDYHLFTPWLPERSLYPVVGEFLANWAKTQQPPFEPIRIVGHEWAPRSHELRELLTRIGLPYGFYPADSQTGRQLLQQTGQDGSRLPVVMVRTGQILVDPPHAELVQALGATTQPQSDRFDLAIVGAGPAGLAAAVAAASEGLHTLVLEPQVPGGQAATSSRIRNYPGFPHGISGDDLALRTFEQAWLFGAEFVFAQQATRLRTRGSERRLTLSDGGEVAAGAVLITTGASWRRLQAPALERLQGAGVFYGAAGAEAQAMRGQDVYVAGAGNSAGQAAVHLAKHAASVTILARGATLSDTMSDYLVKQIQATPTITVRPRTEVVDGHGTGRLEALTLCDHRSGATQVVPASALFVLIGAEPHTGWLHGSVARDRQGYLLTGSDLERSTATPTGWPLVRPPLFLETSTPGVFAAGDVRHRSVKRVASAVGEGAIAIQLIHAYLAEQASRSHHASTVERSKGLKKPMSQDISVQVSVVKGSVTSPHARPRCGSKRAQ